jgi:hypothetical protein
LVDCREYKILKKDRHTYSLCVYVDWVGFCEIALYIIIKREKDESGCLMGFPGRWNLSNIMKKNLVFEGKCYNFNVKWIIVHRRNLPYISQLQKWSGKEQINGNLLIALSVCWAIVAVSSFSF